MKQLLLYKNNLIRTNGFSVHIDPAIGMIALESLLSLPKAVPLLSVTTPSVSSNESTPMSPRSTCSGGSSLNNSPQNQKSHRFDILSHGTLLKLQTLKSGNTPRNIVCPFCLNVDASHHSFPRPSPVSSLTDFDDTSHTDENDVTEAERRSGSGLDAADFTNVGSRHSRKRHESRQSDSESDEDELRSLDDFPVETSYVMQQEEEFGSVCSYRHVDL